MTLIGLADEAIGKGIGPDVILKLVPYVIPKALMFALPATCLFSVCVVYGRLSSENEIVAVESMGVAKTVLIMPAIYMGFGLSLFGVWLNDISFAWSYWGIERVILESSDKIVYGVLKKEGSFSTPQFSIEVDGIDERRLIHPVITIKNASRGNARIVAQEGELVANPETFSLSLSITKGLIESPQAAMKFDDTITHEVPLRTSEDIAKATGNPNHLYLSQIKLAKARQQQELEQLKKINAIGLASQWLAGDFAGLANQKWQAKLHNETEAKNRLVRMQMVPHRRWASGFSCLAFVLVGIPVAIRMRTANFATTFGVCFLPILIGYYPLLMLGLDLGKSGLAPALGAWLANIVCGGLGALLIYREVNR